VKQSTFRFVLPGMISLVSLFPGHLFAQQPPAKLEGAKAAVDGDATVWTFPDYATACMKIDALIKQSRADLQLLDEFDRHLGWIGPALGLTDAALSFHIGRNIDGLQKLGEVGADVVVCQGAPQLCPAWTVGRTIGGVINTAFSMVRTDKRDLTGLLEDIYLSVNSDAQLTPRELLRLKASLAAAKTRRHQMAAARSCADPNQTRNGVDELLRSLALKGGNELPRTQAPLGCDILRDTSRSEALSAKDPDAYDALLAKCL
jgi:hypothetical protein